MQHHQLSVAQRGGGGGGRQCLGVPSGGTPTFTCNITVSPTNLDANLGATSGCLFTEGGGAFCNYGP